MSRVSCHVCRCCWKMWRPPLWCENVRVRKYLSVNIFMFFLSIKRSGLIETGGSCHSHVSTETTVHVPWHRTKKDIKLINDATPSLP